MEPLPSTSYYRDPDFNWRQDIYDYPCSDTFIGYGEEMGYLPQRGYSGRFSSQELQSIKEQVARQGREIARLHRQESKHTEGVVLTSEDIAEPRHEEPIPTSTFTNKKGLDLTSKRKGTRLNGTTGS